MKIEIQPGTEIIFATQEQAKELVRKNDDYTSVLTEFDLQAKIQTTASDVNIKSYLENAQKYLLDWTAEEVKLLSDIITKTADTIKELKLSFRLPKEIILVKSNMQEEGGANGFTRRNYIVLNYAKISEHLFQHELFHILSRHNPMIIEQIFSSIGFNKCNEIPIPQELSHLKISNPDAPFNNYYISISYNGKEEDAFMIIYAKEKYKGGSFFDYIKKQLILVEGTSKEKKIKRNEDGEFYTLDYDEVENLFEQIGTNTKYNIHQEEVCADHFTMLLDKLTGLPNQDLITQMESILKKK